MAGERNQTLTIGMAAYDDAAGVWFTLSSIREHHPDVPILVIDTKPGGCTRTRDKCLSEGATYYHRPDLAGTAAPRDALFRLAETPWVMVVDCHIIFRAGAVAAAIQYAEDHPESRDLIQGPLIGDNGHPIATHWRPTTLPGVWGVWDMDPRGKLPSNTPFDIPAQGLGQFMMRRDAWPGFHPLHRGFGGEEGYIHAKVRQDGGRTLCHPGLGWRHFFRHMEHGAPPPPYPLRTADHTWNLLVTHRELGIPEEDAEGAIYKDFGHKVSAEWTGLKKAAREVQPLGVRIEPKPRLKILGIWYSNNAAPPQLMLNSLQTIRAASDSAVRHDVAVTTCTWNPIGGNPFPWVAAARTAKPGHATILEQQRQAVSLADNAGFEWDAVCFLEHDVLYPADYFDRIGDAFAKNPEALAVSNLDYEGLNETGWLDVKQRHEPMHQLSLCREYAWSNFKRAQQDCDQQGWCYLEPQGDRTNWIRLQPSAGKPISMPSIHVNFAGRFTNHGEVCYEPVAKRLKHPHWGDFRKWWPGEPKPANCSGCTGGGAPVDTAKTTAEWLAKCSSISAAADCWEHLATVRGLAAKCSHVTELNIWGSPWLAALLDGCSGDVVSVAPGPMRNWETARKILGGNSGRLKTVAGDSAAVQLEPTDLLLTDTVHTAAQLSAELEQHAAAVRRFIVIHDTQIYGERGDDGGPGLLVGLRGFLRRHPEWSVVEHTEKNYGLTVLSRHPEDKPKIEPGTWKQVTTFVSAMAAHVAGGLQQADAETAERRLDVCADCPLRVGSRCSKCGCELENSPVGGPGKVFLPAEQCPVGLW